MASVSFWVNAKQRIVSYTVNQLGTWIRLNYRVTGVIVNDSESENLYAVNFINRQTLYRSMGMINKIIWKKYYTDSCSAIIILSSVTTPKNCTIMRRQRYFKTVLRLNITASRTVSTLFLMTAFSQSGIELIRFFRVNKEIDLQDFRRRRSSAVSVCGSGLHGINSCSHNAPNVFNRRQIWRIWRPISRWNVMSDICFCE